MKKYENVLHHLIENLECKAKLKSVLGTENYNKMHINHFSSIKLDLLKSFFRVIFVEDLWKLN